MSFRTGLWDPTLHFELYSGDPRRDAIARLEDRKSEMTRSNGAMPWYYKRWLTRAEVERRALLGQHMPRGFVPDWEGAEWDRILAGVQK